MLNWWIYGLELVLMVVAKCVKTDIQPTSQPLLFVPEVTGGIYLHSGKILVRKPSDNTRVGLSSSKNNILSAVLGDTRKFQHAKESEKLSSHDGLTKSPFPEMINNHFFKGKNPSEELITEKSTLCIDRSCETIKGAANYHHKSNIPSSSAKPPTFSITEKNPLIVNNHQSSSGHIRLKPIRPKPLRSLRELSMAVKIVDKLSPEQEKGSEVNGTRVKSPDTITSRWMKILDAPLGLKTTTRHDKLIVIRKEREPYSDTQKNIIGQVSSGIITVTSRPLITQYLKSKFTKPPGMKNFSVAAVMDPWSNIPIPSKPAWASPKPVAGSSPQGSALNYPPFPGAPFFMTLMSPFINRPLTPNAVKTGMQGIKAMQGFLRNSLVGAMFCFLPSALIALSLSATEEGAT